MEKENRLIAEFMEDYDFEHTEGGLPIGDFTNSWDWLMPVVEKCLIGEAEQDEIISKTTIKNIYDGICNQDISQAYKSVVEFINFYNQNKET